MLLKYHNPVRIASIRLNQACLPADEPLTVPLAFGMVPMDSFTWRSDMKRITMYLIGILASVLAFGSVAVAADFTIYGRVVSGIIHDNPEAAGADDTWDIGSVDAGNKDTDPADGGGDGGGDRLFSRIGIKVSHDLGNGLTGGAHIEKRLDRWRTRHQNVYLDGGLGRVTLGQQSLPYYGAVSWDGANFTGGSFDPGSRGSGINFGSNLGGPFSIDVMLRDDHTGSDGKKSATSPDGVDEWQIAASFDANVATISAGYTARDDNRDDAWGATIGGSADNIGLSWEVGYQSNEDTNNVYGVHLGLGVGGGNLYGQYEDCNVDDAAPTGCDSGVLGDDTSLIFGYSYAVGDGVRVIGEHKNRKEADDRTILAVRVDF